MSRSRSHKLTVTGTPFGAVDVRGSWRVQPTHTTTIACRQAREMRANTRDQAQLNTLPSTRLDRLPRGLVSWPEHHATHASQRQLTQDAWPHEDARHDPHNHPHPLLRYFRYLSQHHQQDLAGQKGKHPSQSLRQMVVGVQNLSDQTQHPGGVSVGRLTAGECGLQLQVVSSAAFPTHTICVFSF